jgi:hypothetical protein
MGLPMLWSTIFEWLKPAKAGVLNVKTEVSNFGRKHKEIPVLKDYEEDPGKNFGISFCHFLENVIKSVNICNLKNVFKNSGLAKLYRKEQRIAGKKKPLR